MKYYKIFSRFYQGAARRMCLDCKDFIKEGSRILDLGCGSGIVANEFKNFFKAEIFGVDIVDLRVEKIPFQKIDGLHLPFSNNSFDTVLISYVLHHAKEPLSLLKEAERVSKRNIIIYEDLPEGFLSKLICNIHCFSFNLLFQKNKKNEGNFKNSGEWNIIFNDLNLKLIFEKEISSFLVKKKLFILDKI